VASSPYHCGNTDHGKQWQLMAKVQKSYISNFDKKGNSGGG
jgi:hypothetical protein